MFKNLINRKKVIKLLVVLSLSIYALTILINSQAAYKPFLMVVNLSLIFVAPYYIVKSEEMENRRLHKWSKARGRGIKINVAVESIKIFIYLVTLLVLGRMVDGVTLTELRLKWLGYENIPLMTLVIVSSIFLGFRSWHQNERRYVEYHTRLQQGLERCEK
jgi:hypothetical protein